MLPYLFESPPCGNYKSNGYPQAELLTIKAKLLSLFNVKGNFICTHNAFPIVRPKINQSRTNGPINAHLTIAHVYPQQ